jgi:hypothetical protein
MESHNKVLSVCVCLCVYIPIIRIWNKVKTKDLGKEFFALCNSNTVPLRSTLFYLTSNISFHCKLAKTLTPEVQWN